MGSTDLLVAGAVGLGTLYFMKKQLDKDAAPKDTMPTAPTTPTILTINPTTGDESTPPSGGPPQASGTANVPHPSNGALVASAGLVGGASPGFLAPFFTQWRYPAAGAGGVLAPNLGYGPAIGAGLRGAEAIFHGVDDLNARKAGYGPYAGVSENGSIVAATANAGAAAAVGGGSLGAASLDFNRGVSILGIPVVGAVYDSQGRKTDKVSFFGGAWTW